MDRKVQHYWNLPSVFPPSQCWFRWLCIECNITSACTKLSQSKQSKNAGKIYYELIALEIPLNIYLLWTKNTSVEIIRKYKMIIQCSAEPWWIINKPRREDIILVDLEVHFVGAPSAEPTKNFRRPVGPRDASKRSRNCTRHLFKLSTSPPEIGLHVWGICNCLSCSLDHNTNLIQLFFTRHTIWFRMLLKQFK